MKLQRVRTLVMGESKPLLYLHRIVTAVGKRSSQRIGMFVLVTMILTLPASSKLNLRNILFSPQLLDTS